MITTKMKEKVWEKFGSKNWTPEDEWIPLYFSKPSLPISRGDKYIKLAPATFTLTRGFKKDDDFDLADWQKYSIRCMFEEKLDGTLRYRQFLLGLPRKQGKSLICSSIVLSTLLLETSKRQIYSASVTMDQAKIVFDEVVSQIKKSKTLNKYLKITESKNLVTNVITGSTYKVIASDGKKVQGFAPYLVIFDEIHELYTEAGQEFWEGLTEASGDQDESLIICITTAGAKTEGLLPDLFSVLKDLHDSPEDISNFGGIWWGAPEDSDISDPEVWKKAMPNLSLGLYSMDEVKQSYINHEKTGRLNAFCRFKLNQFMQGGADNEIFMTEDIYNLGYQAGSQIVKGSKIWVGFDGSVSNDSTTIVAIDEKGNIGILGLWEDDGSKSWFINKDVVNEKIDFIFKNYQVQKLWCDDNQFQSEVQKWAKKYRGKVERIPQSKSRMSIIANDFIMSWVSKEYKHNNDPNLKKHLMNARMMEDGRPIKKSKDSKDKIDIVIALILACGARRKMQPDVSEQQKKKELLSRMNGNF